MTLNCKKHTEQWGNFSTLTVELFFNYCSALSLSEAAVEAGDELMVW